MLGKEKQERSDSLKKKLKLVRKKISTVKITSILQENDIDVQLETVRRWMRKSYKADITSDKIVKMELVVKKMMSDLNIKGGAR